MPDLGVVLTNAGPLIALGKLNRLGLLAELYRHIYVPEAVYREVVVEGTSKGFADALTTRLFLGLHPSTRLSVSEEAYRSYSPAVLLDRGERELLVLARTIPGSLVLLDDETARQEARKLGLRLKGTLGVLVEAWRSGLLSIREMELLLAEISVRGDLWISSKLCQQVLAEIRRAK